MKTLFFDCFSGASGDMMLGALLDAGGDETALREALSTLPMADEFELIVEKTNRGGIAGTDVTVRLTGRRDGGGDDHGGDDHDHSHEHDHKHDHHDHDHSHGHEGHDHEHDHDHGHGHDPHPSHSHEHHHRNLRGILHLLDHMTIDPRAKSLAARIFTRVAEAEAAVHGVSVDEVHFHEVGAVDSIVDIVGSAILIQQIAPDQVCVSPLSVGRGMVRCAHGMMPIPAPATARLLQMAGAPSEPGHAKGELLTPTGAAILTEIASDYGAMPPMTIQRVGYGYGKRDTGSLNALRAIVGTSRDCTNDDVVLMEANIDDMTGEELAHLNERLMAEGALDAWHIPILMKKGRPAVTACALCRPEDVERINGVFFAHSTTLGVRRVAYQRAALERTQCSVDTRYGTIAIKRAGKRVHPEYEDCRIAAEKYGVSLREVAQAAVLSFQIDDSHANGR